MSFFLWGGELIEICFFVFGVDLGWVFFFNDWDGLLKVYDSIILTEYILYQKSLVT